MKKFVMCSFVLLFLGGCASVEKKKEKKKEMTREEIIDMKLKQAIAIAETSLEISKRAEELSKKAINASNEAKATSEKAFEGASKAINAANEVRKFAESETQKAIAAANKAAKMAMEYADKSAEKATRAANEAIDTANRTSEKAISVANQTIAEVNRMRATIKMKPQEPIIEEEPEIKKTYIIKKGDTLSKIAQKFYKKSSKWVEIYKANKDVIKNPNILIPGTKITIP